MPELELNTRADCVRHVHKVCSELDEAEKDYEAWRQLPEVEGNEVALWQAFKAIEQVRAHTADVIDEVARRLAVLEAEPRTRD